MTTSVEKTGNERRKYAILLLDQDVKAQIGRHDKLEILLSRETKLILGQRMYQSMNFLQMSAEELEEYMRELSMENPLLEELPRRQTRSQTGGGGRIRTQSGDSMELPIPDKVQRTLKMAVEEQVRFMHLPKKTEAALRQLLLNLDDRGFLPPDIEQTRMWQHAPDEFAAALELLQGLEPVGVGARSVSECLCLQLEHMGMEGELAYIICRDWLDHLMRSHINHISKAMDVDESEVMEAKELISTLNPTPSNGFDDGRCTVWVVPDVEIIIEDGEPVVLKLDGYMSEYTISSYYESLSASEGLSRDESEYLREKIEQARWALACVARRKETVVACAEAVAREQREFFESGQGIHPCSMNDVAGQLGIHPSTVSRAVKNKYIACRWGVFPMSRFFTREVGGGTAEEISALIRELIDAEDARHPLSDNAICKALAERGCEVARRTVAKYRDEAGIPPATGRKKR